MSAWAQVASSEEAAYRMHRLGLSETAFEVTPGYLRAEEQLRRAMRTRFPNPVPWPSVAAALAAEEVSDEDRAWFAKRREAGEGREAGPLVEAIAMLPAVGLTWRPPADKPVYFLASPALRPLPALARVVAPACGAGPIIAFGPGLVPTLAVLGAAALDVEDLVVSALPAGIDPAIAHFIVLMVAGSVLVRAGAVGEGLDRLLVDVVQHVLPPQHRAETLTRRIQKLADRGLFDQPPGEIERTLHGLGRRRADRVHRAWQRAFFVPRGVTIPGI